MGSDNIPMSLVQKTFDWLGKDNICWFKHVKGLKGSIDAVLRLNHKKRGMPAHPVHFREGMQVRNFLRKQAECAEWNGEDYDYKWALVIEQCIKLL